ncbi:MAG: cysteine--1-D-myo-inosityl 2-amino-2-deoxy-alpha-D-glucopyranoside ligase, partial [Lacisediminihabitans sp.]
TVNGGGSDLLFPHHEFSAAHAAALSGHPLADSYLHAGMVAYQGEKMSKSLGNLVLVSQLTAQGVDPRATRLALLAEHYRSDWEWTDATLATAQDRLDRWTAWAASTTPSDDSTLLSALRETLANDLNTPAALTLIDEAIAAGAPASVTNLDTIAALLGVTLNPGR